MNVYFGGTLYQDTLMQNSNMKDHRSAELYDTHKHAISFIEGSYFGELYNDIEDPWVNRIQHPAVKELGKDLDVYAQSPDGLVEAFGYTKEPKGKVMGVQWHPEFTPTMPEELIEAERLLEAFLAHVKSSI